MTVARKQFISSCSKKIIKMLILSFEIDNFRNITVAFITGILFSLGWWIFIDVAFSYPEILFQSKYYFLPGLCGTAAMILVIITPYRTNFGIYYYSETKCPLFIMHTILFLALVLLFGSFIWATYIWIADFLVNQMPVWPGIGLMLQNLFILISALQIKFVRQYDDAI